MDITVAICAKNAEKFIGECFASIERQTVQPERIILIDDHSEDSTLDIAHRFDVEVIKNSGNKLYDARNTALSNCETEIIAFTDADKGFAAWLHRMWFIVETQKTGYAGGVIGGNSYFRIEALKDVGGWISLPYACAEDVYIAIKLLDTGYKLWFDENIIANHNYTNDFLGLMRKTISSGEGIIYMMKKAGIRNYVWFYTLCIPVVAILAIFSLMLIPYSLRLGLLGFFGIFISTLFFFCYRLKTVLTTIPRFIARWILIWPYALGILKGLLKT